VKSPNIGSNNHRYRVRTLTTTQYASCFFEYWIQTPAHLIKLVEEESGLVETLSVRLWFGI